MEDIIDRSGTPTPTPLTIQTQHLSQQHSPTLEPSSPTQTTVYAPLPTRRTLSQLLRQWQQSLANHPLPQPLTPIKDASLSTSTSTTNVPAEPTSPIKSSTTPTQQSRTPTHFLVSPSTSTTSPHLALTTPTHTRRPSITAFLPPDALLMSPIPRARNPGGFRPTSSGSLEAEEVEAPFGEMLGLVGGLEEKARGSATAWAVVNTTPVPVVERTSPADVEVMDVLAEHEQEELVHKEERDGRQRSKSVGGV